MATGRTLAVLIAGLFLLVTAGAARADGDPASDTLLLRNEFLPYAAPSRASAETLAQAVQAAYAKGFRIKVAVIGAKSDLGAIPSLFGRPAQYARFLGEELSTLYIGPLLIVMPSGYGVYDGGRSTLAEERTLAELRLPASSSSDDLVAAATTAVARLLAAGALRSRDILKPFSELLAGSVAGRRLSLRYYLFDDSGTAGATVTLVRGGKAIFTTRIPSRPEHVDKPEVWNTTLPGGLVTTGAAACIAGVDPSGNRSRRSCKPVGS
jgi:hypothetical protein